MKPTPLQLSEYDQFLEIVAEMRRYQVRFEKSLRYGGCRSDKETANKIAKLVDAYIARRNAEKKQKLLF